MKKLKNYVGLTLITLFISIVFLSCSNENSIEETQKTENSKLAREVLTTCCSFGGDSVSEIDCNSVSQVALVNPCGNGSAQYFYYNTTGQVGIAEWRFVDVVPAGSASFLNGTTTSSGTNVIFVYNSNFESARIAAIGYGDGSGVATCESYLNVGRTPSCTPLFANEFYNYPDDGVGYIENAIFFGNRDTCTFDWSTVSSVKIQIGGVYGVGSNSSSVPNINTMVGTGMPHGDATTNWKTTPSGYRNIKIRTHNNNSNVDPGFLRNNTLGGHPAWATISFNNGCPDVLLYLNDDEDFSIIN